jgi:MFS family permease
MEERQEGLRPAKRFAGVEIPPELKWSHFFNLYVASFLIACLMSLPAIMLPAFLKEVINIPDDQAGSINSGLANMGHVATLLFVGLVGILSDKVGRRILAALGFLVLGIFYVVLGYSKDISLALGITSVPGQVLVTYVLRFIIGIGLILSWPQTITMIADYTSPRDRGKGMAVQGAMMGLGSIVVFGILAQIARKTGLMSLFYMCGVIGLLGAIVSRLGLVDRMPKEKAKKLGIRETYRVVSKSLALKVGCMATLVGRPDITVIPLYLIIWMVYVADTFGLTAIEASAKGAIVLVVMSVVVLFAYPIIGILVDRWGRIPVVVMGLTAAGVGFCLTAATENPFSPAMYLYASLVGIGFGGATVGATALTADASPRPLLGSILGGLNTMQPLGVLILLQVGGFLMDKLGYWAPFALKGITDVVCAGWIFAVRKRIVIPREDKDGEGV